MATINASSSTDIIVPSVAGSTYRGLGGDDTYIISAQASGNITIVDTNGSNTIQLVDGLSITASKFAADSVQLTLSNGAVITVNGADKFTFDVGGNATAGVSGSSKTYAQLAADMGVATLPTGSTISDGGAGSISGGAISTGSVSYSLSAGATSVAEGESITYTITGSSTSDSDVTLTYNVTGDDNDGTVDEAGSTDIDNLSGTVTMAAGETTATFTVTPTADSDNEGLEGIKVTVFDASLDSIGSASALISNTKSTASTTTQLTSVADTIAGGAGDDTISGVIQGELALGTTINAGDVIEGAGGTDTLKISIAGASATAGIITLSAVETKDVEKLSINNFNATDEDMDIDTTLMAGLETLEINSSSINGDTDFVGGLNIADLVVKNGSGNATITYAASTVVGLADTQNITVNNAVDDGDTLTISVAGVETVNLTSTGSKSTVNALTLANATTLNIDGDAKFTLETAVPATVTSINGAASTGGLVLTANGPATGFAVTLGSGNDVLTSTAGDLVNGTVTYEGGAGIDTVVFSTPVDLNVLTADQVTGFEVLGAGANNAAAYNYALLDGASAILLAAAAAAGSAIVSNVPTTSAVTITGTEGGTLTLAEDTLDDTVNLTMGADIAAGVTVLGGLVASEVETIALTTKGLSDHTLPIDAGQLTSLTVSGGQGISLAITNATQLGVIDGSGIADPLGTGLTITANPSTVITGVTITGTDVGLDNLLGGSAADTISGGGVADSIQGAAGNDIINGGGGNDALLGQGGIDTINDGDGDDTILVVTGAKFISLGSAETVDGGAGTDTLQFGGALTAATATVAVDANATAYTVATTDLANVKNVEKIVSGETGLFTLTLDDTFFESNGSTSIIVDNATTVGAMTVSGAALSAANSIDVRASGQNVVNTFTGGKGDDIFTFDTTLTSGFKDTDTVAGGAGTDTLVVNLTAANLNTISNANLVTRVETLDFNGSSTFTVDYTLQNGTFVTETVAGVLLTVVGTVDASGMVGSGTFTFDGALEVDSAMNIDGGRGNDDITGGTKVDTIDGGFGDDRIEGGPGIDILTGGSGDDIFDVDVAADFLLLPSAETVDGGSGVLDTLLFSGVNATVAAADLLGLTGVEIIEFGNAGDDSITVSDEFFTKNGANSIKIESSAAGTFTVNAAGVSAANAINVQYDIAGANIAVVDTITGGSGNDTVLFTDGRQFTADDIINGGLGTDSISVLLGLAAGANLVAGSQTGLSNVENITFIQQGANVVTVGLTTADANFVATDATISGAGVSGVMTINAAAETDSNLTIQGGTGDDILTGGTNPTKVDTISGGLGADTITGGRGSDILTGGAGADIFSYTAVNQSTGTTPDSITDWLSGTDKLSITLDLSATVSAQTVNGTITTAKASVSAAQDSLTGNKGQIVYVTDDEHLYVNMTADNILTSLDYKIAVNSGATAATTVAEGDVNWTLTGSSTAANTLTTGGGADIVTGGADNDIVVLGAGADVYTGTAGTDSVTGNDGADTIALAAANDNVRTTIVYTANSDGAAANTVTGHDVITNLDLNAGNATDDIILISGTLAANGAGTGVDMDNNNAFTGTVTGNGADGGNADITAAAEIVFLLDGDVEIAVGALTTANYADLIAELDEEIDFANADDGEAVLFVVNVSATQAGLILYTDAGSDDTVAAADLQLLAIITHNQGTDVTTGDITIE